MNRDEEFGYIKGQLEGINNRMEDIEGEYKELSSKLDSMGKELAMYRHFVIWIRSALLVGAFVLTMKWGDLMVWLQGNENV